MTYFLTSITITDPQNSDMRHIMVNDVSASSGISSHEQVVNSIPKQSFRWSFFCKNVFYFHIFSFFSGFQP